MACLGCDMPTVTIDVVRVDKLPNDNRIVEIEAVQNSNKIVRTIDLDDYSSWDEFATWLVNQTPDRTSQDDWRRSLEIDFHTETVIDPETGIESTVRVVDEVAVNPLT